MKVGPIEKKWQKKWEDSKAFEAEPSKKKKYYMIFAYPTASGNLHVGHARSYSIPDMIARYRRMQGFNVFFPLGFHATGGDCQKICDSIQKDPKAGEMYGINLKEAKKMKTALDVERYLEKSMIKSFKTIGISLDYRAAVSTIDPHYSKFIEWQFKKLKELEYLIQRDYRLAWCPNCDGPVSLDPAEADITDWKGAQIKDFIIIKFRSGEYVFPTATMRPETVFGVTNIWVNPKGKYVKAVVDGEKWVIAEEAVKKLQDLGKTVHVHEHMKGQEFLGKKVTNPATDKDVPIIFGDFVITDEATGIVMSVPAHDPHDFIHFSRADPKAKPIKVVEMAGFGDAPAGEMLEKMKVHDLKDPKIEDVKKELYKIEFLGKMAENTGKFKGMAVKYAKKAISDWLFEKKDADFMYELSVKPIHCRCGGKVIIKAVKDQWFIDYGNIDWKEQVKKYVIDMNMYPPEYSNELPGIIDWLEARPCVRRKGLGTKFPFDDRWVIEAISDSTIYMAFYIVSKYFNQGKIKMSDLTDKFFDYVMLGKGKGNKTWDKIRKEFLYWYPLDLNCGGKEHKSVHFPFFIYNHVGIFPRKHWPKGVFVNWHLIVYGKKMSKSKGNVVFWKDAIDKYGADAVRLYIAHGSNQWVDFDWKNEEAEVYSNHVKSFYNLADELIKKKSKSKSSLDKWINSRMNRTIKEATEHMEKYEIRKTVEKAFFSTMSDINWYMKRTGKYNVKDVLSAWVKMLAPFMPHAAEEVWSKLGNKKSIINEKWPSYKKSAIDPKIEAGEDMIRQTMGDVEHIKKLAKISKPKKISIFISHRWKYDVYNKTLKGKSMKAIMGEKKYKKIGKQVANYFNKITKKMPLEKLTFSALDEYKILNGAKDFFRDTYGCKIEIFASGKSKHPKADSAEPGKPGILVE